jgi:hypothetical protein
MYMCTIGNNMYYVYYKKNHDMYVYVYYMKKGR